MTGLNLEHYPAELPCVQVSPLDETAPAVDCPELQWWFAIPRPGKISHAAWYDRDSGKLTQVRQTSAPVAKINNEPGTVEIQLDEWSQDPHHSNEPTSKRIAIHARLMPERAEFLSVTMDGTTSQHGDPGFEQSWAA